MLTQARLGEMVGQQLGHIGYSGAAVSDWERDKSKIHADDRLVLIALVAVFRQCGGLHTLEEVNTFLAAGNYRALDEAERDQAFPEWAAGQKDGAAEAQKRLPHTGDHPSSVVPTAAGLLPPALPAHRRKQIILLDKMEHFWVKGVLEKAVGEGLLLDVAWEQCDTAVAHPWQDVLDAAVMPTATSDILDTFFEADRALLILGAPGSGKTFSLITLARDLIARARADEAQPIPVILNLASWAEKRLPLESWIVEELTAKYQVPRSVGREWVETDDLVLLLDGLDEVNRTQHTLCIEAINHFRQTCGLAGIVVCSRLDDYLALDVRLKLSGCIKLTPLSPVQIEAYLTAVGIPLAHTREVITRDAVLREMAQSPLMLRVLSNAYRPDTAVEPLPDTDMVTRRRHIFTVYVNQMFARRGPTIYSPDQTSAWLAWLARKMSQHNQAVFLLEQIQPSWLPTSGHRRAFILTSRLIDGFSLGVVIWMFWLLVRLTLADFDSVWSTAVTNALPIPVPPFSLILFILMFLMLGLLAGAVDIAFYERRARLGEAYVPRYRDEWGQTAVVVLAVSLASFALVGLYRSPLVGLASSLFTGVSFALTTHFIHGYSYRSDIRTIEVLSWSWRGMVAGMMVGLIAGTIFEILEYQVVGPTPIFRTVFSITLLAVLMGGLRGNRLPTTSTPNQGIWLSANSGLAAAGLLAIVMSLATSLFWGGAFGALAGVITGWIAAALYGVGSVLNHIWLRFWLVRLGRMPWAYSNFLDEAANRVLLHKVGGGYIFIHRLLQEHFAQMPAEDTGTSRQKSVTSVQ